MLQSRSGINGNERVLCIPQRTSNGLVSYSGKSLGCDLTPLQRCSRYIQQPSQLGWRHIIFSYLLFKIRISIKINLYNICKFLFLFSIIVILIILYLSGEKEADNLPIVERKEKKSTSHCTTRLMYWEKSWWPEETYCHSDFNKNHQLKGMWWDVTK